jgi:predicted dehydrogenase
MRTANVALIGYGLAGRVFHAPLIAAVNGLCLAAIVSSREDEIRKAWPGAAVLRDPEQAISDSAIDVVVVATPNDSHFDLAARALAHRKHVVIDKPFALTSREARELIARATGRILSVFHNRRWDSDFLTLKQLIGEGALGEVLHFESHFDRYRPDVMQRWRERAGPATGTWFDLGSHLIDQALQLFGLPQGLTADLAARRDGAVTTDYFRVLLRYKKLRVVLVGDSLALADNARFVVHGTRASFIKNGLDAQEPHLSAGDKPSGAQYGIDPDPGHLVLPGGSVQAVAAVRGNYRAYYEGLRDTLAGTAPVPVTAGEALAVMELLEIGEQSSRERREITF